MDEFYGSGRRWDSTFGPKGRGGGIVNFLKADNDSLWLVKKSASNMGRGIEMIRDPAAYK